MKVEPSNEVRSHYSLREKVWIFVWPFGVKWIELVKHEPADFLEFRRRLRIIYLAICTLTLVLILVEKFVVI